MPALDAHMHHCMPVYGPALLRCFYIRMLEPYHLCLIKIIKNQQDCDQVYYVDALPSQQHPTKTWVLLMLAFFINTSASMKAWNTHLKS